MTLKQLQVFLAVARYENMGQAADALFLTKGAVSQALQELERHLGVRLFDRVHPHLRLNHEGAQLRPLADEMLQRAEAIERLFQAGGAYFLNVGASKTIGNYLLPQLLHDFESGHAWLPKAQIANTARLLELVENYTLDVVLLEGEQHLPQMVAEPCCRTKWRWWPAGGTRLQMAKPTRPKNSQASAGFCASPILAHGPILSTPLGRSLRRIQWP